MRWRQPGSDRDDAFFLSHFVTVRPNFLHELFSLIDEKASQVVTSQNLSETTYLATPFEIHIMRVQATRREEIERIKVCTFKVHPNRDTSDRRVFILRAQRREILAGSATVQKQRLQPGHPLVAHRLQFRVATEVEQLETRKRGPSDGFQSPTGPQTQNFQLLARSQERNGDAPVRAERSREIEKREMLGAMTRDVRREAVEF